MDKSIHTRFRRDLIIVASVAVVVWVAAVNLDLFELLHDLLHSHEHWQLVEIMLVLLSISLLGIWFSYRRWQETIFQFERAQSSKEKLKLERRLLDAVTKAQGMYIANEEPQKLFESLLNEVLAVTESEYGFVGRILHGEENSPYLKVFALTNIAWNEETQALYAKNKQSGMEFHNLNSLFGETIRTGELVIANDPASDPRGCGTPKGHPSLNAYMGIPISMGSQFIGMIGIANRPGGFDESLTEVLNPFIKACAQIISAINLNQQREQTEEMLLKAETLHEEAQSVAHIGHWELDLINDKLFWSDENYRIFGVEPGSVNTYETFLERVHPDDLDDVNSAFTASLDNRTAYNIEHRLLMADGAVKWVHEQCRTEYSEGKAIRSIGTVQDITRRKLAELEVIASRDRFSSIVEMAEHAIISINQHQEVILFNRAAEIMFDYSEADLLGNHLDQLIPERFREGHGRGVEAFKRDDSESTVHHRSSGLYGLRKSGEEFPVEISISKVVVGNDVIMTVMIRDMSEQVAAQAEQRKMLMAIREAGEAVMITDRNAVIEYVNPAFCEMTGYQSEEVLGKDPSVLKSHAQDPAFYKELWQTITSGNVWHGTLVDRRKDGSFYPALMSVAPIHNEDGEITHFVSLQQDMTEHEKLEAQFLQAQKMEAIGTLVGGIAHDFNNMLAALQGNVYLAKRKVDDPDVVADKLEKVDKLSARAADMVHQLLTFARKDMVELRALPINTFIKEGLKLASSAIPENIRVSKAVTEQKMLVKGDATQLQQVVMNLLNNAHDAVAGSENPSISVSLECYEATEAFHQLHPEVAGDRFAHLVVADNGSGIPSELIGKVVEPFFTTKGVGKGTGLGLAMVYGAVQTHGGLLEIESEEGQGTTIHIYLPLLQEQRSEERESNEKAVAGSGQTVLLVDDDAGILGTVAEVLRTLGYLVVEASNGAIALDCYREHQDKIAIVLTDMVMPVMGGVELVQQIRQSGSDVPVIMMTGYDFSSCGEEVERFEHFTLLNKPVAIHELSRLMHQMLKSS
ncbi:PAS domain S-box protein [Mariprofundus sp. KV]|uniref:PAS domain S-box protein n=1 Tax=Mariprofundus sp. KV TaxID=2608715 RepID=UPI0015A10C34|nr:PAS domain S-box protein [Mariprofundus sp. KV]NWF36311.1 PAS domain S-box protein [Mariprofundus sp. KV]